MTAQPRELEGTWEEIVAHAPELAGQRVRLIILAADTGPADMNAPPEAPPSSARALLQFAGTWAGDDLEERLREVYAARIPAAF